MFIDPEIRQLASTTIDAPGNGGRAHQASTANAGAGPIDALTLRELQARWAALTDEIAALHIQFDEVLRMDWPEMPSEHHRLFPENVTAELDWLRRREASGDTLRLGAELRQRLADIEANPSTYVPLQEEARARLAARQVEFEAAAARHGLTDRVERFRIASGELDQVLDAIWQTPATTIADIAALLDIALQQPDMSTPCADTVWHDWPYWCLLTRQLHALAPDFEFSWLRRPAFAGDDLVARVLGSEDYDRADEPEEIAAAE